MEYTALADLGHFDLLQHLKQPLGPSVYRSVSPGMLPAVDGASRGDSSLTPALVHLYVLQGWQGLQMGQMSNASKPRRSEEVDRRKLGELERRRKLWAVGDCRPHRPQKLRLHLRSSILFFAHLSLICVCYYTSLTTVVIAGIQ